MSKALVISGGGINGSFASAVESVEKEEYDLLAGSSAGALAILMIAQGKHEDAILFHRTVTNEDVYDINPFNAKYKLKKGRIVLNTLKGKGSFSTTNKLLKIIRKNYTQKTHKRLKKRKELTVVVTNMNTRKPVYISNKNTTWSEFTFWTWVSTLAYPFANVVTVDGVQYADGGFSVSLPVGYACKRFKDVRAIVLNEENENIPFENNNPIQGIISTISVLLSANLNKDIGYGYDFKNTKGVNLQYVFMPRKITDQLMNFIPENSNKIIKLGLETGKNIKSL